MSNREPFKIFCFCQCQRIVFETINWNLERTFFLNKKYVPVKKNKKLALAVSSHSLMISNKYLTVKSSFLYPSEVNLHDSCSSSTFRDGMPAKWRPKSFSFSIYKASPGMISWRPFLKDKIYFYMLSLIFWCERALTYSFLFSSTTSI